jgi:hypothetical protein
MWRATVSRIRDITARKWKVVSGAWHYTAAREAYDSSQFYPAFGADAYLRVARAATLDMACLFGPSYGAHGAIAAMALSCSDLTANRRTVPGRTDGSRFEC